VQSDQLQREIDKLEHKPHNGVKDVLDEAIASSRELSAELDKDSVALATLMKERSIGVVWGVVSGHANTSDITAKEEDFEKRNRKIETDFSARKYESGVDPNTEEGARVIAFLEKWKTDQQSALLQERREYELATLNEAKRRQAAQRKAYADIAVAHAEGVSQPKDTSDYGGRISYASGLLEHTDDVMGNRSVEGTIGGQRIAKGGLEANTGGAATKENPYHVVTDEINTLKTAFQGLKAESNAAGTNPFLEAIAKGTAEANKEITRLNNELARTKTGFPATDSKRITDLFVGSELMKTQDRLNKEFLKDIAGYEKDQDEENKKRRDTVALLKEEIDDAETLAKVEGQGAEAAYQAQLKLKLAKISDPDIKALTGQLDNTEHAASIAKTVAGLDRETAATRRLTDAIGIEAERRAVLRNIADSGEEPGIIEAKTRKQQADWTKEDSTSGYGTAKNGYQSFFNQISANSKSAGEMVKTSLGSAFDGLNQQMTALISGQKTSWASFFSGLASQFAQMGLNQMFGSLAKTLAGGGGGPIAASSMPAMAAAPSFLSLLFGGFKADGGGVDSGTPYMVGERGPELFTPGANGSITPNHMLRSGGGGGTTINVDAHSSTDPDLTIRNVKRAMAAIHSSAIQNSVSATQEMNRRR
jgi:hypothetical protein